MEIRNDYRELLALLNAHRVEYVIVGAHALAFHGTPRLTGDIDIFVRPSADNAERILSALDDFGFGSLDLAINDFENLDSVVQLGVPPVRIDILTSITGVTWEEADAGKIEGSYAGLPVFFLGRTQYIANKRTLGRKKDIADLESLGEG
ncbi:MAG: hypothetical protein A2V52_01310 [Actinobacteria bacterium RBG_19FT_COMBO_54_7]|uniref:Nucleotidyltransferase family protein n=1 Tax=Candidatus Solincola sediminis TaxID=1797199 RepID=A0A1F2WFF6_9ACTN|nr:MAG: hypothetical protein A2Y75_09145 [Candidatus Solincola sediminis]OFW57877.1 MAG: hypothetical protein A2W01_05340 [Candidatus Solincola sediminis]OFW70701.1 MAG: hypothetical protein A2V52_01310 [Actinobacteria bacterium RBG_19FT_COMBO_54_7]